MGKYTNNPKAGGAGAGAGGDEEEEDGDGGQSSHFTVGAINETIRSISICFFNSLNTQDVELKTSRDKKTR